MDFFYDTHGLQQYTLLHRDLDLLGVTWKEAMVNNHNGLLGLEKLYSMIGFYSTRKD